MKPRIKVKGSLGKAVRGVMARRARIIRRVVTSFWGQEVDRSDLSPQAKRRYKDAITPYKTRPGAYLNDPIAELLEKGWDSFDMKPGLLAGKDKRVIPIKSNGATSFRTVSTNSKASSWIHPGFKGGQVVDRVQRVMSTIVQEAFGK